MTADPSQPQNSTIQLKPFHFNISWQKMRVWVDADACPKVIKEILFRAAIRTQILTTLVANQALYLPPSPFIKQMQVRAGFDMADNQIVKQMSPGDLVITADVPLADAVIEKGGLALNPRGELYTENNIKQRLSMRNFSMDVRGSGLAIGGPAKISQKEIQTFANQLEQLLNCH